MGPMDVVYSVADALAPVGPSLSADYPREESSPWSGAAPFFEAAPIGAPVADVSPGYYSAPMVLAEPVYETVGPSPVPAIESPGAAIDTAKSVAIWTHDDSARGLGAAVIDALDRAATMRWAAGGAATFSPTAAVADFRALLAATALWIDGASTLDPLPLTPAQLALLVPSDHLASTPSGLLCMARAPAQYADPSVAKGVDLVLRAWEAFATRYAKEGGPDPAAFASGRWYTNGAGKAAKMLGTVKEGAGAVPLGWPVAVIAVAGIAGLTYLGVNATDAWERKLAREEDTQRLTKLTAAALDVIQAHAYADRLSGKSTPLTPAEQKVIDSLGTMVGAYGAATVEREKKPTGTETLANTAKSIGETALFVGGGLLLAMFLMRGK